MDLDWHLSSGLDLIINDGGNITFLLHMGFKVEEYFSMIKKLVDPVLSLISSFKLCWILSRIIPLGSRGLTR